ncbi:MAG: ferritin-like domain-containing protein [Alphaproteobacteria bacterium]|nr:ferritin-like domain-containing protein [Alphaproteobacteria bacterium]
MSVTDNLSAAACAVLCEAEPLAKVAAGAAAAEAWRAGSLTHLGACQPPSRPARPIRPELRRPGDMPRRSMSGERGRIALLHAIAHIELNAMDLAWDLIARFTNPDLPRTFYDDWVKVAADEGRHFTMLAARLAELQAAYGDLPAHDGLWQAAEKTADDLTARLAVVPMLLEARGLDVTPAMADKLRRGGDARSANILLTIYEEEIGHVSVGRRWFEWSCRRQGLAPVAHWQKLIDGYFKGALKPPFNHAARRRAGMATLYYQPGA